MPFDPALAGRVRRALAARRDVRELRMFGGIAFTVGGRMAVGVLRADLVVKLDPAAAERESARPGVRPMDFTGRPMKGFLYAGPEATKGAALAAWIRKAVAFAEGQGPKPPKPDTALPPELAAALKKAPRARAAFDRLPPSHRREWVGYVAEAKKSETRAKRSATVVTRLSSPSK